MINVLSFIAELGMLAVLLGVFYRIGKIESAIESIQSRVEALERWREIFHPNIKV
ncbi:hypothetical protein [Pelagibius sp.]|uniref:hypothetical protein n=1 Tax=Pelagibius sp. TaxID=1931238 RepID=UPI00263601AF|nr:hypothetical protein [Pelagibius sp.]